MSDGDGISLCSMAHPVEKSLVKRVVFWMRMFFTSKLREDSLEDVEIEIKPFDRGFLK